MVVRTRFRVAYTILTLCACLAVGTLAAVLFLGPRPPTPEQVALVFVRTAVLRDHPERARPLVTAALGEGVSLSDWKRGFIRVVPFPYKDATVELSPVERHRDSVILRVSLTSGSDSGEFLITLDRLHGRWLVSSWGADVLLGPVSR